MVFSCATCAIQKGMDTFACSINTGEISFLERGIITVTCLLADGGRRERERGGGGGDGGREAGRERVRERGREGGRDRGREGEREGERERGRGREGGWVNLLQYGTHDTNHHVAPKSMQLQTVLFRPS